jgi:hypothetical protein
VDAVLNIDVFKQSFEKYKNSQLPSEVAGKSHLAGLGVPTDRTKACWDMLIANGRFTGLITSISGSDRVLSREHALERKFGGPVKAAPEPEKPAGESPPGESGKAGPPMGMPSLNINLEIHLPADVRPEVYDAIFGSMRKHLIDVA